MTLLVLSHMFESKAGFLKEEGIERRLFSTRKKAEKWLTSNNFFWKQRTFLDGDPYEWCHINDEPWSYVNVKMYELAVDCDRESRYKNKERTLSPWAEAARRDGFIDALKKQGKNPEEIKTAYEEYFGEKLNFIL